jgi:transcriptional regulator with XRE-family HTH domain
MGQRLRDKPKELAAKLLAIRRKLELSQAQMAERIGLDVSPAHISEYESGSRVNDRLVLPEN